MYNFKIETKHNLKKEETVLVSSKREHYNSIPVVEIRDGYLNRARHFSLKNINLKVYPGELVILIGANGSGKTTLLNTVSGQLHLNQGEVFINNRMLSTWNPTELACMRAVLSQEQFMNFDFTVEEVIHMGRYPHESNERKTKVSKKDINMLINSNVSSLHKEYTMYSLGRLNIKELRKNPYTNLSGGQKQLTHLGRVLNQIAGVPLSLLLLDEPNSALDFRHQQMLFKQVFAQTQNGSAVLMILHDLNLATRYADRVVVLKNGEIISQGEPNVTLTPQLIKDAFGINVERKEYEPKKFFYIY